VDVDALIRGYMDSVLHEYVETGLGDAEIVVAGHEVGKDEGTAGVGAEVELLLGELVGEAGGGSRDDSVAGIGYRSSYGTSYGLGMGCESKRSQDQGAAERIHDQILHRSPIGVFLTERQFGAQTPQTANVP
jgi:hypothetical protein